MRVYRILTALATSMLLCSCTTVETTGLSNGWKEGAAYFLPKGVFRLKVVDDTGKLTITLAGPVNVADRDFPLVARLPRSGTSDNEVKVTVDAKTSLLSKVDVTSTGELGTIATNIAKALSLTNSGAETTGTEIFAKTYDATELSSAAAADVNNFLSEYFGARCGVLTTKKLPYDSMLKDGDAAERKALATVCRKMDLAGVRTANTAHLVMINVENLPVPAVNGNAGSTAAWQPSGVPVPSNTPLGAACAQGVCYRPMTTVLITLKVRGAFEQRDLFLLPDTKKTLFVSLPQGIFTQQKYALVFTDGVLTEYGQTTKSELVGFTALPVDIVKAVLSAPADVLGLKKDSLKARMDYLDQLAKLKASENAAREACKTSPNDCPYTALKMMGAPITSSTSATPATAQSTNTNSAGSSTATSNSGWLTNDTESR